MFKIYNASAGSGKTYAIVKNYLKIILSSNAYLPHRHILAVTFTNKAVEEMKRRILDTLIRFSDPKILKSSEPLFFEISEELEISLEELQISSSKLIHKILHNYGSFEISTIDKFNHKLIRTFAYDLNLPMNFEVELDTEFLLQKAVDSLIDKVGNDSDLTKVLISYAISKSDNDKSWDITRDLNKSAKLLTLETAFPFLENFNTKDLNDFSNFKAKVDKEFNNIQGQIVDVSTEVINQILSKGLEFSDFKRSSIPNYFSALISKKIDLSLDAAWQKNIDSIVFYSNDVKQSSRDKIDSLKHLIINAFINTKRGVYRLRYLQNIRKNIIPLSVLTLIQKQLNLIKKERNILLISEFNSIISKEIKSQPAPFIYERIGEKFKNYSIDEFQDTSRMQWDNLFPLITNALANSSNSVLIAGDPKQAIYRWRGGDPDQFISLLSTDSSFPVKGKIFDLPTNYRSSREVVEFNNTFFHHISNLIFSEKKHQDIYKKAIQDKHSKKAGYVNLSFLSFEKEEDKSMRYSIETYNTIKSLMSSSRNISYSDICILVRKKQEGVKIANYLISKSFPIISDQSLLISSSREVQLIIEVLKCITNPEDVSSKLQVLNYLIHKHKISNGHQFRLNNLPLKPNNFFNSLNSLGIYFNEKETLNQSLYEVVETVIRGFSLVSGSDMYIQSFLDFIFEFDLKYTSTLSQFLEYYELKKDKLSIVSPKGVNAIQVMTVHKAKGLEFPVVIFPFADLNIYKELEPKEWMKTSNLDSNFPYFLMNYNKDFEHFGTDGRSRFLQHRSRLELDNINLLYVAFTRAIEQLYIIGSASSVSVSSENCKTYSDLLINFLKFDKKWKPGVLEYSYGAVSPLCNKPKLIYPTVNPKNFISTSLRELNISMSTNTTTILPINKRVAIEKGNLVHLLLSKIYTRFDVEITIQNFIQDGLISNESGRELILVINSIVSNPALAPYYSGDFEVYNEREIISTTGEIIIPDRLIIKKDNSAIIIDYKTGEANDGYINQLEDYAATINAMGHTVEKKILIYIYPKLDVQVFH